MRPIRCSGRCGPCHLSEDYICGLVSDVLVVTQFRHKCVALDARDKPGHDGCGWLLWCHTFYGLFGYTLVNCFPVRTIIPNVIAGLVPAIQGRQTPGYARGLGLYSGEQAQWHALCGRDQRSQASHGRTPAGPHRGLHQTIWRKAPCVGRAA